MDHVWIRDIELESLDDYKRGYLRKIIPSQHLLESMKFSFERLMTGFDEVDELKSGYSYLPGKWNIKTMLLHICDTERVFQYRSLCLARDHSMTLTPFDENVFAEHSNAVGRTFDSIIHEFRVIHEAGLALYSSISNKGMLSMGNFNGQAVNAALFGFLICGHRLHHLEVLQTRYLI